MKVLKNVQPPAGLRRLLLRIPIVLYRLGLGWMFFGRLLLLEHVGRISGKPRQAVLEVVDHDPRDGSYIVASGWGRHAAWYQNVLETPAVTIQVGLHTIPVIAVPLVPEEGADVFARYAVLHPRAATRLIPRLMGYSVDGSDADFRAVGLRTPFIRFLPREPEADSAPARRHRRRWLPITICCATIVLAVATFTAWTVKKPRIGATIEALRDGR